MSQQPELTRTCCPTTPSQAHAANCTTWGNPTEQPDREGLR